MSSKGGVIVVVSGEDKTGEVFAAIKKHNAELQTSAKETSASLGSIGESLQKGLAAAGIAIGLREVIGQLKEAVTVAAEFGESIEKAQIKTGIAAGTLSVLHYAAATTGSDFEQLVKGAARMGKNMADAADGNKKLDSAFRSIGVNAKDLVGRTDGIDIAFKALGKTLAATESPAQRNQLLIDLLGKSGMESAPAILNLAENFDALKKKTQDAGVYLDQMSAEKLANLNHSLADMKERVLGASVAFTEGLQPSLEGCLRALTSMTGNTDIWSVAGKQMGLTIIPLVGALGMLSQELRQNSDEFRNNAAAIDYLDASIGAYLDITGAQRAAAAQRRDAARQEMHDTKVDYDLSIQEEKSFHDSLLSLKNDIEHPTQASSKPASSASTAGGTGGLGGAGGSGGTGAAGAPSDSESPIYAGMYAQRNTAIEQARQRQRDQIAQDQATAAYEAQQAWAKMQADAEKGELDIAAAIKTAAPQVTLAISKPILDASGQIEGEAEKFAHGVFDPLFDFGEKWDKQWKQIRANMLRDLGQGVESQLFGALFGDPEGKGGKGLNGTGGRKGVSGSPDGLVGEGLSAISGMFSKKASPVSNGTGAAGAGAVLNAAAGAMQIGKGGSGSGGIQVVLNNQGPPQQVSQTQQAGGDGGEGQVIQIMLKQLETNGPVAQGIAGLLALV